MLRPSILRLVAVTLATALSAAVLAAVAPPATAAPAVPASAQDASAYIAHILETKGLGGIPQEATLTLTRKGASGEVSAAETITCSASSTVFRRSSGGWWSVYAQGRTRCPVVMDDVRAQTSLWEWNPFVGRYLQVIIGSLAYGPGQENISTTPEFTCATTARNYVALTYHSAYVGDAAGSTVTQSLPVPCSFVM